jgi:hypothetical protein
MAIKLYKSQAQADTKSTNVSATSLAVSPGSVYGYAKSAAAAGDAIVNLALFVKKTKDSNKASEITTNLESNINKSALNFDRSSNPNDLSNFSAINTLLKDKLLIDQNTAVKNKVNSWFKSNLSAKSLDLEKSITKNVIAEKIAKDKIMLAEKQKIIGSSNNVFEVNAAKDAIANYFLDDENKLFYKAGEWATLKHEQNEKIQQNAAIMLATNDPVSVIDNPKIVTDHVKDKDAAKWILEKAYENHAKNIEAEIKDQQIIDAQNLDDQANNFAELAVRIKDFHENANNKDFSDKLIDYSEIKRAFINNDIDETMYHKLIDYRAGVVPLDDDRLIDDINNEILTSDTPVELQELQKRIQVKESDLSFLNLSAEASSKAVTKINKLKKDSEMYSSYKSILGVVKAVFFASESYDFSIGEDARTVKAIGNQAVEYFDDLVMNKGVDMNDALFRTIAKFNPGKALPNLSVFPLPTFSEESNWSDQIITAGGEPYFIQQKDKIVDLFKKGTLTHGDFVFEMDNLDKAHKLYTIRYKYAVSDPTIAAEDRLKFAAGEGAGGLSSILDNLIKKN